LNQRSPNREFVPAQKRRVRRRTQPLSREDLTCKREAHLLRKLLARTGDGQVLTTLKGWRSQLSGFLREHRQRYKEMRDACDAWWRLPWDERGSVRRPPRPPSARHIDVDDAPWIIDDRLLRLLDDLIERLQKWLEEA
jgi:hypothetical protein